MFTLQNYPPKLNIIMYLFLLVSLAGLLCFSFLSTHAHIHNIYMHPGLPQEDCSKTRMSQQRPSRRKEGPSYQNDVMMVQCDRCYFRFPETDLLDENWFTNHMRTMTCKSPVYTRIQKAKNDKADLEKEKHNIPSIPPRIEPVPGYSHESDADATVPHADV
jgi:hypothetical protein